MPLFYIQQTHLLAFQFMKNTLIALVLLLVVTSCLPKKKDKDPEPELAGTYQVSRLTSGGQTFNLPLNGVSAAVIITRPSDTQITFVLETRANGRTERSDSADLTIRKASGKDYDILDGSTRLGSLNGTDFTIDGTDDNGDRIVIVASK